MKERILWYLVIAFIMIGISLYVSVCNMETIDTLVESKKADESRIAFLERQVSDIQENYVSFEALQPVLTDFENHQLEDDQIRNNLNDFNSLWKQLFDYEQKQYNLRGR